MDELFYDGMALEGVGPIWEARIHSVDISRFVHAVHVGCALKKS